jgi:hypothetical protein
MIVAGWAKLTGLLLTATMVGATLGYLFWRGRLHWRWALAVGVALVLAAAPYIVYLWQYGSPTPETPAQIALLQDGAHAAGWTDLPRKSFPSYAASFVVAFIADWMPVVEARSIFNYAMLAVPVAALAAALIGVGVSLRQLLRHHETPLDVVVVAGSSHSARRSRFMSATATAGISPPAGCSTLIRVTIFRSPPSCRSPGCPSPWRSRRRAGAPAPCCFAFSARRSTDKLRGQPRISLMLNPS